MSSCGQLWIIAIFKSILRRTKTKKTCLNNVARTLVCSQNSLLHFSFNCRIRHLPIFYLRFFRDRFITTVNVLGDAMGTGIVEHLSRDDLRSTGDDDASVVKPLRMSENEAELQYFSNVWERDKFSVGKNACSCYIFNHTCVLNSCSTSASWMSWL